MLETSSRRPVLLCVDDDPETLGSLRRLLRREPYEIVTTVSAREALERLGRSPVDIVIADERMPDISGTEFLRIVEERSPATARLIVSGHPMGGESRDEPDLVQYFIPKPWRDEELRDLLRGLVKDRPAPPAPRVEGGTARRPAGPDFMAEQPVLVDCTQRSGDQVMTKLVPWLRRARKEGRDVLVVMEGLPLLKDSAVGLLADLVMTVDLTGIRLHLLEGSGLAAEYFMSSDSFHPRIVVPARAEPPKDLLLVDPLSARRVFLKVLLSAVGHRCRAVATAAEARSALDADSFDLLFIELSDDEGDGIDLVRDVSRTGRGMGVIPLLSKMRVWTPSIARKWNLRCPVVRPYRFTDLYDAAR